MTDTNLRPLEAPKTRKKVLWPYWAALLLVVGVGAFLFTGSLGNSLVFYVLPSEYKARAAELEGRTLQIGALVKVGSVKYDRSSLNLQFVATDGTVDYPVHYVGGVPDLFKDGMGVIVEGKMANGVFQGSRLLVKHSEEYKAPTSSDKTDLRKLLDNSKVQ